MNRGGITPPYFIFIRQFIYLWNNYGVSYFFHLLFIINNFKNKLISARLGASHF